MPKAPILRRTLFYEIIPGSVTTVPGVPQMRLLDFCAVETELGTMVEPRQNPNGLTDKGRNIDAFDADYTDIQMMDAGTFKQQYGTGGNQWAQDYFL